MASTKRQTATSLSEQVLALGYRLYIEKGCPEGAECEIWQEAERMLKPPTCEGNELAQPDRGAR